MRKIAFYTLGCKVNQSDTASMERLFREAGYEIVDFAEKADIYLINTCVVTNMGQRKSRQMIHRAIRKNPNAFIVVSGCYPQTAAEEGSPDVLHRIHPLFPIWCGEFSSHLRNSK